MANGQRALGGAASGAAAGTAIMPGWGTAIGGVAGGLAGLLSGDDHGDEINALQQQAMQEIQAVQVPELKQALLQKYISAGVLTPEMEQTFLQQPSQMNNISVDPRLKDAQMGALAKLQQMGNGGLQPEDLATLHQIQRQSEGEAQAKQQQVLQDMQQRGQGGSGAELAARLMGAQQSANRASMQGDNVASLASQRALQSIMNAGQLGGSMRQQDFGEQSAVAQAQDAINKFNAANRQGVATQNTNRANYGQQYNLGQSQQLSNQNVDQANKQPQYNQQLAQQDYENRLRKAQGLWGADTSRAGQLAQQDAQSNQGFANVMGGAVGAANAYGQTSAYDRRTDKMFPDGSKKANYNFKNADGFGGGITES